MTTIKRPADFNVDSLVSAQVDEYGALECVYRRRYLRASPSADPYEWPVEKQFNDKTLQFTGARENFDVFNQSAIITEATYRGHAFTKNFISMEGTVTPEPITAHPDFETWAGTSEAPIHANAIWETSNGKKRFVQFRDDYDLAGITTYLAPQWTVNLTWLSESINLSATPGKRYNLPTVPNFEPLDNLEYIATAVSQEQNGGAFKITAQLLAAPNWSTDIYEAGQ